MYVSFEGIKMNKKKLWIIPVVIVVLLVLIFIMGGGLPMMKL